MKCFLFDVDGTLTKPREAMEAKFADIFESWISEKYVYLVSGSDLSKIKEQIPNNILKKCKGIFPCMGIEFWVDGEKIYENEHAQLQYCGPWSFFCTTPILCRMG